MTGQLKESDSSFFGSAAATSLNDLAAALGVASVYAVLGGLTLGLTSPIELLFLALTAPICVWSLYVIRELRHRDLEVASLWRNRFNSRDSAFARLRTGLAVYRDMLLLLTGVGSALGSLIIRGGHPVVGVADLLTACATVIALGESRRRRRDGSFGLLGEPPQPTVPGWLHRSRATVAVLLATGFVVLSVGAGFGFTKLIADESLVRVDSAGTSVVTLPSGQDLLYVGLLGEGAPKPFGPRQVRIVQLSTGRVIQTRLDPSLDRNSPDGVGSLGLISFVIPQSGRFRVTIDGPRGLGVWAGTSPGTTVRQLAPWMVVTGLGLLSLVLGIVGSVERRRRRTSLAGAPALRRFPRIRRLPVFKQPYEIDTPLDPVEVAQRLSARLQGGVGGIFVPPSFSDKRRGWVSGDYFRIRARPAIRNTATYEFEGQILPTNVGSRLVGKVGPSAFLPVFLSLWFGLLGIFEVFFVIMAIDPRSTTPPFPPLLALAPLGMMAFGVLLVAVITNLAQSAWKSTELWLLRLLVAAEPGPTPSSRPSPGA